MIYNNPKMDLNSNLAAFSCINNELNKNYHIDDTTLRLECYGHGRSDVNQQNNKTGPDNGCRLVLGIGPTPPGIISNKNRAPESFEGSSVLELSLSNHSSTSKSDLNPLFNDHSVSNQANYRFGVEVLDEGSTSAKKSGGYMPSLILAPRMFQKNNLFEPSEKSNHRCHSQLSSEPSGYSIQASSNCQTTNSKKSMKGARCSHPTGCSKAARGKTGLCIKHGGGKHCMMEGCTRSAEGQVGLCISHGGGKRCVFSGCTKGAQGSTMYCKAHGGGKRCVFPGCTKGAEGSTPLCKAHGGGRRCRYDGGGVCPKSVHSGTNFCVAHGGGKRCVVPGCAKSARGRTDCCVRHGGGRRCKYDNCTKSAQGRTDFCKAHGGGRRCIWDKCEKFARGKGGLCAGHANNKKSVAGYCFSGVSECEIPANRRQMIPPQVLVPLSMKSFSPSFVTGNLSSGHEEGGGGSVVVPEGRVHAGGLLSLLGGNLRDAVIDGI